MSLCICLRLSARVCISLCLYVSLCSVSLCLSAVVSVSVSLDACLCLSSLLILPACPPYLPALTEHDCVLCAIGIHVVLSHVAPRAKLKAPPVGAAAVEARVALEQLAHNVQIRRLGWRL